MSSCPVEGCDYKTDTDFGLSIHTSRVHGVKLSEEYPEYTPERSQDVRDKISESNSGKERDAETKEKMRELAEERAENGTLGFQLDHIQSKAQKTNNKKIEMGEHPFQKEETRKKAVENRDYEEIAEKVWRGDNNPMNSDESIEKMLESQPQMRGTYIDKLGYSIDSTWELHVAFMLEALDVEYEREPQFDLGELGIYHPDFITNNVVIEVKGYYKTPERAATFMDVYPEYTYVVVGEHQPCNIHIPWSQRDQLMEVVRDALRD